VEVLPVSIGAPEVELNLLGQPALGGGVEGQGQTDRHFRRNARATVQDGRQGLPAHAEGGGRLGHGETERAEAEFAEHFSGVGRVVHLHECLSGSPRSPRARRRGLEI